MENEKTPWIKKYKLWFYVFPGYIAVLAIIFCWCFMNNPGMLREQLISVLPWFLEINFLLIVIGFILNIKSVKNVLEEIPKRYLYLLLALIVCGILLAMFAAPRVHRLYYDENIYLNIGQNIAFQENAAMCAEGFNNYGKYDCAQLEHNKQPYAYPYLIAVLYRVFGASEIGAFLLNNFIFGLSIFVVFIIAYLLFNKPSMAIYSALVFCLIPENTIWSNTTTAEPGASLFAGAVVASALIYLREKNFKSLLFFVALIPFAIQFRIESIFVIPLVFLLILLRDGKVLKDGKIYLFGILALTLLIPFVVQLYAVRGENWGNTTGTRMDWSYLTHNFKTNSLFYIRNAKFPFLFTIFFFIGLFFKRVCLKERCFTGFWFLSFWGVFLFFYAGSYEYGQDVRFSLVSYMPLSIIAGLGVSRLEEFFRRKETVYTFRVFATSIIVLSFLQLMPHVRVIGEEAWGARYDHYYARKMLDYLPERSIVLTHNPNMFLLWGGNAAQASIATNNKPKINDFFERFTGGVYFHYNFWCNINDPVQQAFCNNILKKYKHEIVVKYKERNFDYVLYKLVGQSHQKANPFNTLQKANPNGTLQKANPFGTLQR